MGLFHTSCLIMNHADRGQRARLDGMLVDTGGLASWVPAATLRKIGVMPEKKFRFKTAAGELAVREIGYAVLRVGRRETTDEVVFARPGDMRLLGARAMEGLHVRVDPVGKKLIPAGPVLAASPQIVATAPLRKKP